MTFMPIEMPIVLFEVAQMMQMQAKIKGLKLVLETDEICGRGSPFRDEMLKSDKKNQKSLFREDEFWSDANRIKQIVLNLVGNAMKFTLEGEVRISACKVGNESIKITDTGIGIKEEDIQCLFEEFGKLELSNAEQHLNTQGIGLGLIISHNIAKNLNYSGEGLIIESSEDAQHHGTHFSFLVSNMSEKRSESSLVQSYKKITINMRQSDVPQHQRHEEEQKNFDKVVRRVNDEIESESEDESEIDLQISQSEEARPREVSNFSFSEKHAIVNFLNKKQTEQINEDIGTDVNESVSQNEENKFDEDSINPLENSSDKINVNGLDKTNANYNKTSSISAHETKFFGTVREITISGDSENCKTPSSKYFMDVIQYNLLAKEQLKAEIRNLVMARKNCMCSDALVVEDNAFSAYCLQKHLSAFGLEVDIAASGRFARDRIEQKLLSKCCSMYRFVFLDYNLGDCVGPRLAEEIKEEIEENLLERFPLMIACTGDDNEEVIEEFENAGVKEFLAKPIDSDRLLNLVYSIEIM